MLGKNRLTKLLGSVAVASIVLFQVCAKASNLPGQKHRSQAASPSKATAVSEWEPSADFLAYMKKVEGYRANPYDSFEGGTQTVGIGHKLKPGESVQSIKDNEIGYGHHLKEGEKIKGLSEKEATALLVRDLKEAYATACRQIGYRPQGALAEIVTEFTFNGCGKYKFPHFFEGLRTGNAQLVLKHYKRHSRGVEMKLRNRQFAERYLDPKMLASICGNHPVQVAQARARSSSTLGQTAKKSKSGKTIRRQVIKERKQKKPVHSWQIANR